MRRWVALVVLAALGVGRSFTGGLVSRRPQKFFRFSDNDKVTDLKLFEVADYDALPRRFDREILLDFFRVLDETTAR